MLRRLLLLGLVLSAAAFVPPSLSPISGLQGRFSPVQGSRNGIPVGTGPRLAPQGPRPATQAARMTLSDRDAVLKASRERAKSVPPTDAAGLRGTVHFDEASQTFRLYGDKTMYAFRVDDIGLLEHLYWGPALPPTDDLRYITFSNQQLCFDPGPSQQFEDDWAEMMELINEATAGNESPVNFEDFDSAMDAYDKINDGPEEGASGSPLLDEDAVEAVVERLMEQKEEEMRLSGELPEPSDDEPAEPQVSERFSKAAAFAEGFVPAEVDSEEQGEGTIVGSRDLKGQADAFDWNSVIPRVGRNTKLLEWADLGTGDYRPPSFSIMYEDGSNICPLSYKGHKISDGRLPMTSAKGKLPQMRGEPGECSSLVIELEDKLTGLEVDIIYTVYRDMDAIARRVIVRNPNYRADLTRGSRTLRRSEQGSLRIDRLMSATVDFHTMSKPQLVTLSGSWANERHMRMQALQQGKFVSESLRGTSSHQHNPFFALTNTDEEHVETSGDVWAFSFVYSGNFMMEAEVTETGRTRINAGINPSTFRWDLPAGDSFETPECVLVYSSTGLEGMTHTYHKLYRKYLIPDRWYRTVPPVLLNTWEAMYFEVSHQKVVDMARVAATVGVELIVLDDGWFGQRDDATSSLGDWFEDERKFPYGLKGLAEAINDLDLKFGLWVEPEMVNVNSKLYKAHPEWCLNQQGRNFRCEGRNQLVLDFSRTDVQNYVISKLRDLLSNANIEYIKWDMNRHLTEVYGNEIAPSKQGEVYHRFDAGMLHYSPQIWASDNTDVFSRMAIQHGTSLVYPLSSMGSHITEVPNHQTQRLSTLKTRFLVALFGTFGLELDVRRMSGPELSELALYVDKFKELAPTVLNGDFYRLWNPVRSINRFAYAWMCTAPKDSTSSIAAVVAVFLTKTEPGRYLPLLQLRGLDPDAMYLVEEIFPNTSKRNVSTGQIELSGGSPQWQMGRQVVEISGQALMNAGIPVRLSYDGDSCAFVIHKM